MDLITQTIAPGETCNFERAGTYFEIIDVYGRINVKLNAQGGVMADEMRNALSGFYSEEPFSAFTIQNAEAWPQTVTVMVSDRRGGSRRQRGEMSIIDQVKESSQIVNNSSLSATSFSSSTLLAPGSNTRGVTVTGASVTVLPNGGAAWIMGRIVAAAVAPSNMGAATSIVILADVYSQGSNLGRSNDWNMRRRVPAGWGLYHCWQIDTGAVANQGVVSFQTE